MDLNKQTVKALLGVACGSIAFAAALLHPLAPLAA